MTKRKLKILDSHLQQHFLPYVRRPARYIGGEINQIKKNLETCDLKIALCFPDIYEIAMSYSGLPILYDILNSIEGVAAERVFSPWTDAEEILRQKNIPIFSLESKASLDSFDVIGFSLTNELCYTNVLNMLDLGGLRIRSCDRKEDDPIVIAGGGMANCCEPVADFIDLFVLGPAEDAIVELAELFRAEKLAGKTKEQTLLTAQKNFDWIYVPSLYEFKYENSHIESFSPLHAELPNQFKNAVVEDFENAPVPLKPIVPFVQAVHERVSIEIMRGCPGRCLFCQASYCKRPIQYRSVDRIAEIAKKAHQATGFDTITLLSLSTANYPDLEELTLKLHEYFQDKHVGISLPSLRVDEQLKLLPKLVNSVRKSGLTIAVEAATEQLRDSVNKPLTNENLFAAVEAAYRAGWQRIKLYFMAGLPGETEDDIKKIVQLCYDLAKLRKNIDGKNANINAAISWLVPKPHTPLGWTAQKSKSYFENVKKIIFDEKRNHRGKFVQFKFHAIEQSILESAIGRADRRMSAIIENAWENGARFDLWSECFDYEIWKNAFEKAGCDLETSAQVKFTDDQFLPWQHLACPKKQYLLKLRDSAAEKT